MEQVSFTVRLSKEQWLLLRRLHEAGKIKSLNDGIRQGIELLKKESKNANNKN